jgi:hydrogenase-4 component E
MMDLPLVDWLPRSNAINLLAGAFLLSALAAASQRRAAAAITAYAWNSWSLAGLALVVAAATGAFHILVAAALVAAIKGFLIPRLLLRAQGRSRGSEQVDAYLGIPATSLIGGALVVVGFSQTRALFGTGTTILASCLPISVAATLVGLLVMVTRRHALMQVLGLVLVENAIFLAAVSLTYGMPLVVEIGVLLDLLVGVALLGLLVGRIEAVFEDADTSRLTTLKG